MPELIREHNLTRFLKKSTENQTSDKSQILKKPTQSISTLRDFKAQTCDLFLNASKTIQLYTHGLDPRILNNLEIEKTLIRFIKKSRSSQIQILIYQEELMRGIDHRLVALAQRFTSYVSIKVVPKNYHENSFSFYLIDGRKILHRNNVERYEAENLTLPNFLIKEKSKIFSVIWQASPPASFLRALHL